MKILLLGKNGQVGWELQRSLTPLGEVIALDRHGYNGLQGDMSQPEAVKETILKLNPDIVVNASAYTAVDLAETEQDLAQCVNFHTVQSVAEACLETGALLVHYSTDYVFNGQGQTAFLESHDVDPINVYGQTKAQGEQAIAASGCKYLIFRTSWVYAAKGKNFLKTMLNLAQQREELSIINDQIGAPTSAELIADITAQVIPQVMKDSSKSGIYHLVASGETSWFEYANYVFEQAKLAGVELMVKKVNPIPTTAYPTPAKRPCNSRLDNQKLQSTFQLILPDWKLGVQRTLTELLNK
ncbi:MAG: dTDP-4-dehydrorhamnose reductase [Acinetobacter sp.]|uniref:dTDP-4-dehydrorhamnose reductase n=1 Tax=Acinetobacter sp. TaxID=472 RepID=UPI00264917B7|nr:dTDP-4-dehydrorhamnose reductase [Acinetobacter sp.]MDN5512250.1 dTDP-4-dehydrorhamnose reductase [Acinetobacter sp.]MDN5557111.1 dTDP-4-dehydrorhamnose reductase [Acinetobacter sp.]